MLAIWRIGFVRGWCLHDDSPRVSRNTSILEQRPERWFIQWPRAIDRERSPSSRRDLGINMQWSKLRCPKCQANYPLARLYARYLSHTCPACDAGLVVSLESSACLGKTLGIILCALIPLMQVSLIAWRGKYFAAHLLAFMAAMIVAGAAIGFVLGPLILARVGEFIPKEHAPRRGEATPSSR